MVKNCKVKSPNICRCFKKLLFTSAEASAKPAAKVSCKKLCEVWGRKRERPWKQTDRIGQLAQKFIWQVRDSSVPESFHNLKPPSSLGSGWNEIHCPPARGKWWKNSEKSGGGKPFVQGYDEPYAPPSKKHGKPLGTGFDTHTHT